MFLVIRLTVLPILVIKSDHINPLRHFLCDRVKYHRCPVIQLVDAMDENAPVHSGFWEISDWDIEAGLGRGG